MYAWWAGRERARAYFGLLLFLTGSVVGVFASQDLLLFYAFFEAMLIPLYVLIGVWGGAGRLRATITFVVYTVAGSLLMLAAIIVYGLQQGTFDLTKIGPSTNDWIFLGFAIAFAIKAPFWPFHGWLPDAYRESPPEIAGMLSGVVSKVAAYGFLRIAIVKFPGPTHDFRVPILVLCAIGLVYGSLLAFRAPDIRGVVAYSSLAQMGLIGFGLFADNSLGFDGSVLQMVNHGLISMTMFLLAGMVERRTSTGELSRLGGMARGRPALATILMTVGVMALAVPLSSNFAGEFLILAGVFQQGWAWAVIGAGAIVLAAMYMLRLISAVLHRDVGPAVDDAALDLRRGELAIVVPLVAILLVLSAWPDAISGHSFISSSTPARDREPEVIHKPHVDWFAISPSLSMLAAAGALMMVAVFWPKASRRLASATVCGAGFVAGFVFAILVDVKSPNGTTIVDDSLFRDRWAATAQILVAACGFVAVLVAYSERMREENIAEYYLLLAAAGAGMAFFLQAANLITLFIGLEWFSIALYVLCAIDIDLVGSLEAGLKYLIIGAVGSATLLFGSALVYGATGELSFDKIAAAGTAHDSLLVLGLAMMLAGFGFKASAAPFHMWTPDAYQGAPTPVTAFMSSATKIAALVVMYRVLVTAFPEEQHLWTWACRRDRDRLARDRQHRGARAAERQAPARLLVGLARRVHADRGRRRERHRRAGAHVLPDPLLRDVPRRLRRDRRARARARDARHARQPLRLRLGAAVLRGLDVGLHARFPRFPADRRLLGEDLRLRRHLPARLVVADRDRRRLHDRLGGVLPRGRAGDVPARQRRAPPRSRRRLTPARGRPRHWSRDRALRDGRLVLCGRAADPRGTRRGRGAALLTAGLASGRAVIDVPTADRLVEPRGVEHDPEAERRERKLGDDGLQDRHELLVA